MGRRRVKAYVSLGILLFAGPFAAGTPGLAADRPSGEVAGTAATTSPAAILVGGGSPYVSIQQGIDAAETAGLHQVIVAAGTYTETDTLGPADTGLAITAGAGGATLVGSVRVTGASSITLSGLKFHGNGADVAISVLNSTRISIEGDNFAGVGQAVLLDGTSLSTVTHSTITHATRSAIEAKHGAANNSFTYLVIDGDAAPGTLGAIWLHGTTGSRIDHDRITNTAGAGISLTDFDAPGGRTTRNTHARIACNALIETDKLSKDSGAIYILGRSQMPAAAVDISMNYVLGAGGAFKAHAVGIYLDDNASGITVSRNIIRATPGMTDAFEIHGGSNNRVSANVFDLGTGSTAAGLFQQDEADQLPANGFQQLQNDIVSGNIYVTESTKPHDPGFADFTGGIDNITVTGNDYWAFSGAPLNVQGAAAAGDLAPRYEAPARQPASSLSDYAMWSGAGISFEAIGTCDMAWLP